MELQLFSRQCLKKTTGSRDEKRLSWFSPLPSCCVQPPPGLSPDARHGHKTAQFMGNVAQNYYTKKGGLPALETVKAHLEKALSNLI